MIKSNRDGTVTLTTGVILKLHDWRDNFKFIYMQEGYYQMVMNKHIDINVMYKIYESLRNPQREGSLSIDSDGLLVSQDRPDDLVLQCINAGIKEYKKDIESSHFEYKAKNGTKTIVSMTKLSRHEDALIREYFEYNNRE